MRYGTSGASEHVTSKPSIRKRGMGHKSVVYAQKALRLTPGDLPCDRGRDTRLKLAEGRAIDPAGMEKSAEGIVVPGLRDEGPNGMRG